MGYRGVVNVTLEQEASPIVARGPYKRGNETHERILATAIVAFGFRGFHGASAREIATEARVKLPAVAYHFGNKTGLYRACAEHIVAGHNAATAVASRAALGALATDPNTPAARTLLSDLLRSVAELYMNAKHAPAMSSFLQRELADPGAAYDILFEQLWKPGTMLVTDLIHAFKGPHDDRASSRANAILLIGGVINFGVYWRTAERLMEVDIEHGDVSIQLDRAVRNMIARL